MRYWKVTAPIQRKDGSIALETAHVASATKPKFGEDGGEAVEIDRLPGPFEQWDGVGWVKDEAAEADHREDARLRAMSPRERQREAVDKAKGEIMAELRGKGFKV